MRGGEKVRGGGECGVRRGGSLEPAWWSRCTPSSALRSACLEEAYSIFVRALIESGTLRPEDNMCRQNGTWDVT